MLKFIFLTILIHSEINCIWPPPYEVNWDFEDSFVINESIEKKDVQDVYEEEELIKKQEAKQTNQEKYFRLHRSFRESFNINNLKKKSELFDVKKKQVYEEFNPDKDELVPWKAGFVDEKGNFKDEQHTNEFDEEGKEKRESENGTNDDYLQLKLEYQKAIKKSENANVTITSNVTKEDEPLKDKIKSALKFKEEKNCTEEDTKGIGLMAIKCNLANINKPKMKNKGLEKCIYIISIWTAVYLIIAIPLWCQYGWCCCCCRCKFCKPKQEIEEVKKFFVENPIGVYHDKHGEKFEYKATYYERYAQKQLEKELGKL